MTNVSRADKRCAREIISSLESSSSLDIEKIRNFKKYLSSLGFSEDSEYFSRINSLEGKLNEKENAEREKKRISEIPKVLKYSGVYCGGDEKNVPIKLDFRYNHLFLSRNYKNKFYNSPGLKISWRLESDGKLYLIDSLDISSRNVTHVLGPINNDVGQFSWSKDLEFLFYSFPRFDSDKKIDLLLKWGYTSAKELFNAVLSKKLKDSNFLRGEEIGLSNLVSNPIVTEILKKSSKLHPYFEIDQKVGRVIYN